MSNNNTQGNDQIIAVYFKKSLIVIVLIVCVLAVGYLLMSQQEQKEIVKEQTYQAPTILKKEIRPPSIKFTEQSKQRGIKFKHTNGAKGLRMLPETMGSGVAFIDFDNDGDEDIIFINGSNWSWDETITPKPTQSIYANDGNGYFTDVSSKLNFDKSFYGTGLAIGDINNDGFDDVFVAAVGKNRLFINKQGTKFIESDINLDCTKDGWSTSSGFFDYDNDGDLDLMILNYVQWSKDLDLSADYKIDGIGRAYGPPSNFPGTHNCLYENTGDGQFVDVTQQSGIIIKNKATGEFEGKSLALIFLDINNDGFDDIIVANDTTRNFVFINQQNKTFKEQGSEVGLAYNASGKATGAMGLDSAHFKNDEDVAVTIGNFANEMTSFYVNRSNLGFFTDESVITGIGPKSRQALSFGLFFFDYDLDGRLDFFQTNGHVENDINKVQASQHYAQKSQLFWNCGKQCERTYMPIENAGDLTAIDLVGRAASYADVDGDGDLDIIITQVGRSPKLFINELPKQNWMGVILESTKSVLGAKITYTLNGEKHKVTYTPTKSYLSQVQKGIIIGLANDKVSEIMVDYKGQTKKISNLTNNQWNRVNIDN